MRQAFIKLHLSILLAGFTGLFGKFILLNEALLTWYRMSMTTVFFLLILLITRKFILPAWRDILKIFAVGCLLCLHWILFYGSVKTANVSIAVVCFASIGFFTSIIEPIINRHRISPRELLLSLITIAGIMLVFHFDSRYRLGIVLGMGCAAVGAFFTIYNRKLGAVFSSSTIFFYEMLGGALFLTLILPAYLHFFPSAYFFPSNSDWLYLLVFALVCTTGLCLLQIQALKILSAFTVNLSYNLEPLYSIILAWLLLGENRELNWAFYAGLALILLSVLLQTVVVLWQKKRFLKSAPIPA